MSQYRSRAAAPYVSARCSLRCACTRSLSSSVLSTSNRNRMEGVALIAFIHLELCRGDTSRAMPGRLLKPAGVGNQLLRDLRHTLRLEAEFSLQLLERGRGAKCVHADDAA